MTENTMHEYETHRDALGRERIGEHPNSTKDDEGKYSDIISDGGMDPRTKYEEERYHSDKENIKEEIWNRFMEKMKFVAVRGEDPILPANFLGSVEKHKEQFMKIDIRDLTK